MFNNNKLFIKEFLNDFKSIVWKFTKFGNGEHISSAAQQA